MKRNSIIVLAKRTNEVRIRATNYILAVTQSNTTVLLKWIEIIGKPILARSMAGMTQDDRGSRGGS